MTSRVQSGVVTGTSEEADIPVEGLFPDADAGFDSKEFRKTCGKKVVNANICFNKSNGDNDRDGCFDQKLYDKRYAIERTNAWMDSYRSRLTRFDTTTGKGPQLSGIYRNSRQNSLKKSLNDLVDNDEK